MVVLGQEVVVDASVSTRLVKGLALTASFLLASCARAAPVIPTHTPAPTETPLPPTAITTPTATVFKAVGQDISVDLPPGDPERGAQYWRQKEWDCAGCHELLLVGPPLQGNESQPGIATRAAQRIGQANYEGGAQTVEQYLFESIVRPEAHVVEGYPSGLMPDRLGDLMTPQETADMIAFLMTLN